MDGKRTGSHLRSECEERPSKSYKYISSHNPISQRFDRSEEDARIGDGQDEERRRPLGVLNPNVPRSNNVQEQPEVARSTSETSGKPRNEGAVAICQLMTCSPLKQLNALHTTPYTQRTTRASSPVKRLVRRLVKRPSSLLNLFCPLEAKSHWKRRNKISRQQGSASRSFLFGMNPLTFRNT